MKNGKSTKVLKRLFTIVTASLMITMIRADLLYADPLVTEDVGDGPADEGLPVLLEEDGKVDMEDIEDPSDFKESSPEDLVDQTDFEEDPAELSDTSVDLAMDTAVDELSSVADSEDELLSGENATGKAKTCEVTFVATGSMFFPGDKTTITKKVPVGAFWVNTLRKYA